MKHPLRCPSTQTPQAGCIKLTVISCMYSADQCQGSGCPDLMISNRIAPYRLTSSWPRGASSPAAGKASQAMAQDSYTSSAIFGRVRFVREYDIQVGTRLLAFNRPEPCSLQEVRILTELALPAISLGQHVQALQEYLWGRCAGLVHQHLTQQHRSTCTLWGQCSQASKGCGGILQRHSADSCINLPPPPPPRGCQQHAP